MSDSDKKTIPVSFTVDVERIVSNEGGSRHLAVALKMFKDIVMKLSAKKF